MRLFQGKFVYDTVEELTYALLNVMDLSTRPDGTVIDKSISPQGTVIMDSDKVLKANTDPNNIHYAGESDVLLDPLVNLHLLNNLFGLYADKIRVEGEKDLVSMFSEEIYDANMDRMSRCGIKFDNGEEYYSEYYYSKCLGLIELIFILGEENVSLRNFDITPTEMEKIRKEKAKEAAKLKKQKAFVIVDKDSENK